MAGKPGKKYDIKPPVTEFLKRSQAAKKYFYVDGKLYRAIVTNRPANLMRAWSYEDNRMVDFVLTDVQRHMQQAYNTAEVAKLLNRTKKSIFSSLRDGVINPPYKIGVQESDTKKTEFGLYKWSEDDVIALHAYYLTVSAGRPRKDGIVNPPARLPTRMELVAMMKQNRIIYMQDVNGNFVPVFDTPDWT